MTMVTHVPYHKKNPKVRYTAQQKNLCRFLYEYEGLGMEMVSERSGIYINNIRRWAKQDHWQAGKEKDLFEQSKMQYRIEAARKLGLGEAEQMFKAKELMEATQPQLVIVLDKEGKPVEVHTNLPDYKTQNEGLKRAIELTGTKIERREIDIKATSEIVHRYELPEKKAVPAKPDCEDGEFNDAVPPLPEPG